MDDKKVEIKVINKTDKPFTVNWVDHECKEGKSDQEVAPGETFEGISYNGHVFRVREAGTNNLLQEIVIDSDNPVTTVTAPPAQEIVSDSANPVTAPPAQETCSKQVDDKKVEIKVINKTDKPFTVNWVDHECKEGKSDQEVAPGETFEGISYNGHVFRVREVGTNKLLQEIVIDSSNPVTTVSAPPS